MINPNEFLNKKEERPEEDDLMAISGSFTCQECDEIVHLAKLHEDKRKIIWTCSNEHYSEARL